MKRKLILFLCVVLCLTALFSFSACGESACAHDYQSVGDAGYFEKDGKVYIASEKCSLCGENKVVEGARVVQKHEDSYTAIVEAGDNAFLFLKNNNFIDMPIYPTAKNLYLCFEKGSHARKVTIDGEVENLTIDGLLIRNGLAIISQVNGITLKNCSFTGSSQISNSDVLVKNFSLINCQFVGISSGGKLTAVRVNLCENLTVKDCTFDTIEYNPLQIGGNRLTGTVIITGNTFKGTGSSVIHLANCHLTDCDISGNVFYLKDNLSGSNYLNILDEASGIVKFGVNTWEVIPEATELYFEGISSGKVEYNMSEQLLLQE
ncbi:MAG: hypothetical protein E7382_02930 [Clostridiales bacterium]|nr:hypothetical protein [Clostridiales bacterium]